MSPVTHFLVLKISVEIESLTRNHKRINRDISIGTARWTFTHHSGVDTNASWDILGKDCQITWSDNDIWRLIKHEFLDLLNFNWRILTWRVKRIETLLLKDTLKYLINFCWWFYFGQSCIWWSLLDHANSCQILIDFILLRNFKFGANVQTHIFDDIDIHHADRDVIQHEYTWIAHQIWLSSQFLWIEQSVIKWWLGQRIHLHNIIVRWNDNNLSFIS